MNGAADPIGQARREVCLAQLDPDDLPENPSKLMALMTGEAGGDMVLEVPTIFHGEFAVQEGVETPQDLGAVNHGPGHAPS
jgi:hypothetical protein